jgi:hypothetical protein
MVQYAAWPTLETEPVRTTVVGDSHQSLCLTSMLSACSMMDEVGVAFLAKLLTDSCSRVRPSELIVGTRVD